MPKLNTIKVSPAGRRSRPQYRRSSGWFGIIHEQRDQLESLLQHSPSMSRFVPESIALSYPKARRDAALATGVAVGGFPGTCPYTEGQILHADYLAE